MRSTPLALALAGALVLAACGGDDSGSTATVATTEPVVQTTVEAGVENLTGDAATPTGDKPVVQLPSALPTELVVTELVPGNGPAAGEGDTVLVDYVGVRSEDGTEFDNSYDRGQPLAVTLGSGGVIQGWDEGLRGAQQGARLQLDIPAALAYGDTGSGAIIQPGDALSFVIDVRVVVPVSDPDDAPDVELEPSEGATEVTFDELLIGEGPEVVEGTTVFLQLLAYRGDSLDVLDNTWVSGGPLSFPLVRGQLVEGLYEGLLGMQVGGRRAIVVPPEQAFGEAGNDALGLPAGTDLILVVDLIAAY